MTAVAQAALEPVRRRLQRDAEEQAAQLRAAARGRAADIVRDARRDAAAVRDEAAAAAAATAAGLRAAELRRARHAARSAVLAAQRAAVDDLRQRVAAAVGAMPAEAGYDEFLRGVISVARRAAGPRARLTTPPAGGVVARGDGVVVDCSLTRLADLAVTSLGAVVRELWTP